MVPIFNLLGRVATSRGLPIENLRLAVVEKDPFFDDLLGVGCTDQRGCFRISFTQKEFNQEWLEKEEKPEIYIVFSICRDQKFAAIDRQEWSDLKFDRDFVDLGLITIDSWVDAEEPSLLKDQESTPGYKNLTRLELNDDLALHCIEEVTPLVEGLTGWPNLLKEIEVRVSDQIEDHIESIGETLGFPEDEPGLGLAGKILARNFLALYDPLDRIIVINREQADKHNLDALKVILGHELVHVGQFREHPELIDDQWRHLREVIQKIETAANLNEITQIFRKSALNGQMSQLEGYAHYIQTSFLQHFYNCATFFHHRSFLQLILTRMLKRFIPEIGTMLEIKKDQYIEGGKTFVDGQEGSLPMKFTLEE